MKSGSFIRIPHKIFPFYRPRALFCQDYLIAAWIDFSQRSKLFYFRSSLTPFRQYTIIAVMYCKIDDFKTATDLTNGLPVKVSSLGLIVDYWFQYFSGRTGRKYLRVHKYFPLGMVVLNPMQNLFCASGLIYDDHMVVFVSLEYTRVVGARACLNGFCLEMLKLAPYR